MDVDVAEVTIPIVEGVGYAMVGPFLDGSILIDYCVGTNTDCGIISNTKNDLQQNINIYPNPTSQFLILDNLPGSGVLSLSLCDIFGRTVLKRVVSSGNGESRLDLYTHPSGIYMLTIEKGGFLIQKSKIIKL